MGPGDQESPKVDGDIVVWEDNHSGNWDVLAKDLATNRVFTVTDGLADERYPDISGNLVVWQDARNGPWAIYGAQLSGDTAGPAFPISSGPGDQINPRVSGSQVVWQSSAQALATTTPQNAVRWDIVGTDLATGGQFTATTNTTTNFYPAIDRGIVVWQSIVPTITLQLPSGRGRWDILGYTIATGTAFTVAEDLNDKTNPDINGDLVVWQEYLGGAALAPTGRGRWGIHGHEISSGRTFTVTDDLDDQTNPAIVGSTVAYADSNPNAILAPLGRGRWAIDSADVTTGVTQTISTALTDATLPAIASSHIVWQQLSQAGDSDVYGNVCRTTYSDVTPGAYFYAPVQWFACSGMISGYGDGTFRPYNNTTRGQLAKIVVLSEAWPINTAGGPHFADVPPSNPFYSFVETAYQHGIISGYRCGGPGEPCDAQNHPYFRWGNEVTRGQIAKIIVGAAGWAIDTTGGPHFVDVPPGNPFYAVIETAYNRGIVSGYSDGTFRWVNNAIRGQIAKILYGALSQP
ncbi:MAG TPA: S-layer homology domain-containing protein [Chloroflexia bacterium]|nr:S-layer homology domain-containing protein [Chloroflexia bacterium]